MPRKNVALGANQYVISDAPLVPPPAGMVLQAGAAALGPIARPLAAATVGDPAFYGMDPVGSPDGIEKQITAKILAGSVYVYH